MPDFENIHAHAKCLALLTDPDRTEQRLVITWPVEVGEHWEALADMWRDPKDDYWNGFNLSDVTPAHIAELDKVYSSEALEELKARVSLHRQRQRDGPHGLERVDQINIDARHAVIHQPEAKPRRARCGNCGIRYDITEDPTENHHRAMHHAQVCKRRPAPEEHASLINEFRRQPMPQEFQRRAEEMIAAGADPAEISRTGVSIFPAPRPRRPWWKFWR